MRSLLNRFGYLLIRMVTQHSHQVSEYIRIESELFKDILRVLGSQLVPRCRSLVDSELHVAISPLLELLGDGSVADQLRTLGQSCRQGDIHGNRDTEAREHAAITGPELGTREFFASPLTCRRDGTQTRDYLGDIHEHPRRQRLWGEGQGCHGGSPTNG